MAARRNAAMQPRYPTVKFNQIPANARFIYRGETYRKVSPLQGVSDSDGSRCLIPRSATVALLDEHGTEVGGELPALVPRAVVESVFDDYRRHRRSALSQIESALTDEQLSGLRTALESADRELWTQLAVRSVATGNSDSAPSPKGEHAS